LLCLLGDKLLRSSSRNCPPFLPLPIEMPEGCFGKAIVMKSNAQFQRFQVFDESVPIAPSASSSSRPSNAKVMSQLSHMTDMLQYMDQHMRLIETDVAQIKINVRTTLCNILPKDRRDEAP